MTSSAWRGGIIMAAGIICIVLAIMASMGVGTAIMILSGLWTFRFMTTC